MSAISLRDVTKRYGTVTALRGVNLTVESGEVFGFLGPNGAGKSTTISMLLDHVRPTDGTVEVLGMDAGDETVSVRERTGVLPETFGPLGEMTGREHVEFALDAKGMDGNPDGLLVLDEPTTGLDPNGAREIREIVREENERGTTVFFSSHILEQVEAVCDRVGILNRGELAAVDTIDGLREAAGTTGEMTVELASDPNAVAAEIRSVDGVVSVQQDGTSLTVGCENTAKGEVVRACHAADLAVENIETNRVSLEDLFAAYTGGR